MLVLTLPVFSGAEGTAVTTEQRIAAIEISAIPPLVIKGETLPIVTLRGRMEQLKFPS